jgi:anti-sigma factor RsiW
MSVGDGLSHVGDALSAFLDGELGAAAALAVHEHVTACPACAAELDAVRDARAWVRALPPVDPPFGVLERMRRTGRRRRVAAAGMAAAAVASVAFVGSLPARERPVKPAVATLVRTHAITASVDGDSVTGLATASVPVSFRR